MPKSFSTRTALICAALVLAGVAAGWGVATLRSPAKLDVTVNGLPIFQGDPNELGADLSMTAIGLFLQAHYQANGKLPESLGELKTDPAAAKLDIVDPWKNPYTFTVSPDKKTITLGSNGPDGRAGTADDKSHEVDASDWTFSLYTMSAVARDPESSNALREIAAIVASIKSYRTQWLTGPDLLVELKGDRSEYFDPWGTPYEYVLAADSTSYTLGHAGSPDGKVPAFHVLVQAVTGDFAVVK